MYLSYLMGAKKIENKDLVNLGIQIEETKSDGDRTLNIPDDRLPEYIELVKNRLDNGFWNEIVGDKEIIFIFKFKDGSIKEYKLSQNNEKEISLLCSKLNGDLLEKTANVYRYISGNRFYKDFMMEHYADLINHK